MNPLCRFLAVLCAGLFIVVGKTPDFGNHTVGVGGNPLQCRLSRLPSGPHRLFHLSCADYVSPVSHVSLAAKGFGVCGVLVFCLWVLGV